MKKRSYNSQSREVQATQTRNIILATAKNLFQTEGFDGVTISHLAKASKVSMPTIYAIFKSKRGVLQALIDEALPQEQFVTLVNSSMQEPSPKKRLIITASLARQIYDAEKEFINVLRSASGVAPELRKLEEEREKRRYERQGEYMKKLWHEKRLLPELTLEKARAILWTLTGRDLYRMLVVEKGWTPDEYEQWLGELLIKTLLKQDA